MDQRREEGLKLTGRIFTERIDFYFRHGRFPTHLTMGFEDIWRLWIALAEKEGQYVACDTFAGMQINVIKEFPDGFVVVS